MTTTTTTLTTTKSLTRAYDAVSQFLGEYQSTPKTEAARRESVMWSLRRVSRELYRQLQGKVRKGTSATLVEMSESLLDRATSAITLYDAIADGTLTA